MIRYLNTDLVIHLGANPERLINAFEDGGIFLLWAGQDEDRRWRADFETVTSYDDPESTIGHMLAVVESLEEAARQLWSACQIRTFDTGYECGNEPWPFVCSLSSPLLHRIAAAGADLRITIYPDEPLSPEK